MKITSYPITRDIRIGRIKSDPCEIVFVLNEDGSPMDLTGKVLELVFLTGNHAMLTLSPDDIDGNKAVFALTEEEKNKLYANLIYISVKLDGVTIGEGRFEWGSTHGEKSELPKAIGINVNNVTESIEWFEVVIGPRGPVGKSAWQYAVDKGYTGTEEDFALEMARLPEYADESEGYRDEAVAARDAAITARGDAVAARTGAETAAGNASGSATAAGNYASNAAVSAGAAESAKNVAGGFADTASTQAGVASEQAGIATIAKQAAESANTTAQGHRNAAEAAKNAAETAKTGAEIARDDAQHFAYLSAVGSLAYYGIEFDTTIAASALTRIGNLDLHRELPYHRRIRHCLLLDNGTVNYYTHADNQALRQNGLPADLTGADGQRMIKYPESYWRFERAGNKRRVLLSEYALPGFFRVAPFYVSADGACMQRSTGKLASVVNSAADYRGGNNNAAWDSEARTLLQREATAMNLAAFRNAARLRGNGWEAYPLQAHELITWLIRIEYANLNCQLAYTPALDANGFRQGGLGSGVTNLVSADWTAFNSQYPFLPTGIGASLGNGTGIIPFDLPIEYKTPTVQVQVPVWRGLANPFGYIWRWLDGVLLNFQAADAGGESRLYTTYDRSKFSSTGFADYEYRGLTPRNDGYIKEILFDDMGGFLPAVSTGGSSATYFSDYWFQSVPASGVSLRGCLVGGSSNHGANAGLGCAYSYSAPSATNASIGSRLCFFGA